MIFRRKLTRYEEAVFLLRGATWTPDEAASLRDLINWGIKVKV